MRECMVEKSHTKLVTLILLFFMLIITVIKILYQYVCLLSLSSIPFKNFLAESFLFLMRSSKD